MDFTDCTIDIFMKAAYNQDFSKITVEEYNIVNMQYQDASGLYLTREFELRVSIHNLTNRINCITAGVAIHREFIKEFNFPYLPAINELASFGYLLIWNNDIENFKLQLTQIEGKEARYKSMLFTKTRDLESILAINKDNTEISDIKQSRAKFTQMIISLQKLNYRIEKDKTTIEELAAIINDNRERSKDK
jgi:hypothetical protein